MKPKSRWIEQYNLEFDLENQTFEKIFNTSEILNLNIKPKVIWFVRYMLEYASSDEQLEEGEIKSDDDFPDSNKDMVTNHVMASCCYENEKSNYIPRNPTKLTVPWKYKNNCRLNVKENRRRIGGQMPRTLADRCRYSWVNPVCSNKFSSWTPLIQSSWNSNVPYANCRYVID